MAETLLDVATIIALLVLVLWGLTQLRDEVVALGWLSMESKLGRMSARAARARVLPVLQALGVDEEDATALRTSRAVRRARANTPHIKRPDVALLSRLKAWTRELEEPYEFRGSNYYVDTMGAVHHRAPHEPSLAQVLSRWLAELQAAGRLADYDAVLTPKDGNPILAYDLCTGVLQQTKVAIICKGRADPARVTGPSPCPHPMDFEGLDILLDRARQRARVTAGPMRIVAVDDSCTSGATICDAVSRLNELIRTSSHIAELVSPVTDVVVLFRVLGPGESHGSTRHFQDGGLSLRALLALGPDEMRSLVRARPRQLVRLVKTFKTDEFACSDSIRLFDPPPARRS